MNTVIIGAGIVGLHIAQALQSKGHQVFVLEAEPYLAEHTSGRNSGVIHAGIFYKEGSLKETLCLKGNRLTYQWLKKLQVPFKKCGKWIIAEPGQEDLFDPFFKKLCCLDLKPKKLSAPEVLKQEPHLRSTEAILVDATGIVDTATYLKNLAVYLENQGGTLLLNCKVLDVKNQKLSTTRGDIDFDLAINCAGLFCDEIAKMTGLKNFQIKPCRGDYYLVNQLLLTRPVYHLPYQNTLGLGVHLTPTMDGQTLIGPNSFFIENKTDYDLCSDEKTFKDALSFYLPEQRLTPLTKAYAGNRPKLFKEGRALPEFTFIRDQNWIHTLGIESPGLTAAPALAEYVLSLI